MDPNGVSSDTIMEDIVEQIQAVAAVAILPGQFVKFNGTLDPKTGLPQVVLTDATLASAPVCGVVLEKVAAGGPCAVFGPGVRMHYAAPSTFTLPQTLYLDVTSNAGGLSTVATTGDAVGVARAISDQDIQVVRNFTAGVNN
jgi:hypothetical protein